MRIRPAASQLPLQDALDKALQISTPEELVQHLKREYPFWDPDSSNITMRFHCHDSRIGSDTYVICVAGNAALFADGPDVASFSFPTGHYQKAIAT